MASIPQPVKYGLDMSSIDPNLEIRLRNMEVELAKKAVSTSSSNSLDPNVNTRLVNAVDIPPAPTGFSIENNVKTITVKWDESPVGNLLQYEIHLAKDSSFTDGFEIFKRKDTTFTFDEGDSDTSYFMKVRINTQDGQDGEFTGTLDTKTGQIVTADIVDESTSIVTAAFTAGALVLTGSFATMQTITFTSTGTEVLILFSMFVGDAGGTTDDRWDIQIKRGTTVIFSPVQTEDTSTQANAIVFQETPSAGSITYTVEAKNVSGGAHTTSRRSLIVLEVKK